MNWPMIVVGVFMFFLIRLGLKGVALDKEIARRNAISRTFEIERIINGK